MKATWKNLPLPWVAGSAGALLAGFLAGPVVLYWLGGKLAGPYGDPAGLLALWGSIYGDAARLGGAGLAFLLGPLLIFQIAWFGLGALRKLRRYSGQK
ncbi:hypothetical protein [Candidatus Foliamicus sp.]